MSKLRFSFLPMNAGLSNQKLACIGLVNHCILHNADIVLPMLVDFSSTCAANNSFKFSDVFCVDVFSQLLENKNVRVLDADNVPALETVLLDANRCFINGTQALVRSAEDRDNYLFEVLAGIRPVERLQALVSSVSENLVSLGIKVGVQLRIERDWLAYAKGSLASKIDRTREEIPLEPIEIFSKISRSFLIDDTWIFATCNELDLSMELADLRNQIKEKFNCNLVFKSEFNVLQSVNLTTLERSIIDFELVFSLQDYIGLTRSTFFNVASATGFARGGKTKFYFYNTKELQVKLRKDKGQHWEPNKVSGD